MSGRRATRRGGRATHGARAGGPPRGILAPARAFAGSGDAFGLAPRLRVPVGSASSLREAP